MNNGVISPLFDKDDEGRFITKRARERFVERGDGQLMLARQSNEVMVGHLIGAAHRIGADDAILTAKIIGNKSMARIRNELAQNGERLIWRHAVAEHRVRRDAGESQLGNGTG